MQLEKEKHAQNCEGMLDGKQKRGRITLKVIKKILVVLDQTPVVFYSRQVTGAFVYGRMVWFVRVGVRVGGTVPFSH